MSRPFSPMIDGNYHSDASNIVASNSLLADFQDC